MPVPLKLVVHGGCGVIHRTDMSLDDETESRQAIRDALTTGMNLLQARGSAVDAVIASIVILEDSPHFNAGKGAVFTAAMTNELDAGIMDGETGRAAGVSGVMHVKNPIRLAQLVASRTPHCILCGDGAEGFARQEGVEMVGVEYFATHKRKQQLQNYMKQATPAAVGVTGTVGAVALDAKGRLASGSSTGGRTGKMVGRLSDSSIPGAGYFADVNVAVSGTGDGDYFLQISACHTVASLMRYNHVSVQDACDEVVFKLMADHSAGLIAVDRHGNTTMPYNSEGMFRGTIDASENTIVKIWDE